jgi:phosphoenolpyruvate carboxykinase (ATP)
VLRVQAKTKVRVICTRPYHAHFMRNMMIRPSDAELAAYGAPDFTIFNAGACPADPCVDGVTSTTSVAINIEAREMVILGTEYAGEMKKGIFSVMHYLMPLRGVLTLHSGCNMGAAGDVTLFFGLSGTGALALALLRCVVFEHVAVCFTES